MTENLYPQDWQWRENLTNKTGDVNSSPVGEETFWVTKTTDAEEVCQESRGSERIKSTDADFCMRFSIFSSCSINHAFWNSSVIAPDNLDSV
ncbi:MAG TPA: hypothetical protein VNI60_07195 [Pyrinomonadaceae bacterium]|jgi:hypothetical protein|nr:hypothetical protein [Pyrinomonadaceae bacterium]